MATGTLADGRFAPPLAHAPSPPGTCITDELLAAWVGGGADSEQVAAMTAHVTGCDTCRTVLAELARTEGERPTRPHLVHAD